MNESDIKRQIRELLTRLGAVVVNIWLGVMRGDTGIADLIVCYQGRFIAIETKTPGWHPPSPTNLKAYKHYVKQKSFLDSVERAGGIGMFAQSVEDVVDVLDLNVKIYPLFSKQKQ